MPQPGGATFLLEMVAVYLREIKKNNASPQLAIDIPDLPPPSSTTNKHLIVHGVCCSERTYQEGDISHCLVSMKRPSNYISKNRRLIVEV